MNLASNLASVEEAAVRLRHAESLGAVQEIVRSAARAVARAHGATIVLREGDQCYYADEDAVSPLWKGQRFPVDQCISGWAMLHGETVVVPDISADHRIPMEAYRPTFVKSLAMVPVGGSRPIGAIGAYWATLHRATADELESLTALAVETFAALQRSGVGVGESLAS